MYIHLTTILSAVKDEQQASCNTTYSRSDFNHMWKLKNSKDLFQNLNSCSFSEISSLQTLDLSTLYKTFSHEKGLFRKYFSDLKNCVVLGYKSTYYSIVSRKVNVCNTEEHVCSMLDFLIDNIFVICRGAIF